MESLSKYYNIIATSQKGRKPVSGAVFPKYHEKV
jgi:hypothetical protein